MHNRKFKGVGSASLSEYARPHSADTGRLLLADGGAFRRIFADCISTKGRCTSEKTSLIGAIRLFHGLADSAGAADTGSDSGG